VAMVFSAPRGDRVLPVLLGRGEVGSSVGGAAEWVSRVTPPGATGHDGRGKTGDMAGTTTAVDCDITDPGGTLLRRVGPETESGAKPMSASPGISAGQVFADILLLAALSCQTPFAVVSVPQPGGTWSTLSHGFDQRVGLNDGRLFDELTRMTGPAEIDLLASPGMAGSPLAAAPHEIRWAYGVALRGPSGAVLGVVAVLDRAQREASRRERRAMLAVARQMTGHLSQLRKVAGAAQAWPAGPERELFPVSTPAKAPEPAAAVVGTVRRAVSLPEGQQLLRSHEVAVLFDVTERTVINWAAGGKLPSLRTIGGHLRFRSEDVLELLAGRSFPTRTMRSAQ
jgi:excisionase family DNA binding protein